MMSKPMQKAYEVAKKYDTKLLATEFSAHKYVLIEHEEGTRFLFRNAFMRIWEDEADRAWIMVFTEHQGFHVFDEDDLITALELTTTGLITKL